MCEACPEMVNHNEPHMEVCSIHNRWVLINRADGTMSRRDCPECSHRKPAKTFVHLPTGRIIKPAIPLEDR